ncbi:MAG: DNA repair protein RecN [Firmicutes bacterium]|nr:DNA repair protein RecN [Bacillota bacterium]
MIEHISIRDFAIIENTEIDFSNGLSVITGETGSGKSIVVTAISLALGSRADSSYVRHGSEKAVVELSATVNGEEIVISREVNVSGKNLCRLNGRMVSLAELFDTCKLIADIHGQYDNQSLLDPASHLAIVDDYRAEKIDPIKNSYLNSYNAYSEKKKALNQLLSAEADNTRKLDFYRYEIKEIDEAKLVPGEYQELKDRLSLLQNGEKIYAAANRAREFLNGSYDSGGAYSLLGSALSELETISEYSKELSDSKNDLSDIYYRVEDLNSFLRDICEGLTFSPQELDDTIARIALLDGLIKKYAKANSDDPTSEILSYRDSISESLKMIENYDEEKARLTSELSEAEKGMNEKAAELTAARQVSALDLTKKIKNELVDLNFSDAELEIAFSKQEPSPNGFDAAEILISTNRGEPLKPLIKTASGGEISRIMLAIKSIASEYDNIPTLIFDEIDQGISGKTAAVVGKKLKDISKHHQVICITHLPQIAAASDTSYRIYKESDESSTYTHVDKLSDDEKIEEVARLIGGETITDAAREAARALIN